MSNGEAPGEGAGTAHAVFLSYARADRRHAVKIVRLLERAGYSVWWDGLLEIGERFSEITERALENAHAVVVLWSHASIASHWVQDEAGRGRDRHRLVPVSIDGSKPPLGFRQFQVIDVSGKRFLRGSPEARRIVFAVEQLLEKSERDPLPAPTTGMRLASRRAVLAATGTLAIAAGGGALVYSSGWFSSRPGHGSIAVLPFANLSGDPSQDYFSDGLSEELRATLSQDPQLSVAAQTSSNAFRGQDVAATEIATKLKVADILDGSVRRSGDRLRINIQLTDGASGFEKWTKTFEKKLADIFEVQTEIALRVADALVQQLSGERGGMKRIGGTDSPEAYDAYLQGSAAYASAADEAGDRRALALFDRAVELDPNYAVAHAARSTSLTVIANTYSSGKELAALYDQAIAAARRALVIAPDLAEANLALGFVLFNGRLDAQTATEPYQHSYEVGFGNARVLAAYAGFAGHTGDFEDARQAVRRAEELDPLNPSVFRTEGLVEYEARNFDAATRALDKALSLDPELASANGWLGDIALLKGDFDGARAYYEREPRTLTKATGLAILALKQGAAAAEGGAFARQVAEMGDNSLYQQAQVAARRGERDAAIGLLERAYDAGDSGLVLSRNDPMLDSLRGDPRFSALLQKLGFTLPVTN